VTVDQIIALAASVGTCVAAVFALLALRESATQRKTSYRPQFALKRQTLYATGFDSLENWAVEKSEGAPLESSPRYNARLFNIGLGPAKAIEITWKFDHISLIEEVNRLSKQNGSKRAAIMRNERTLEIHTASGSRAGLFLDGDRQTYDFALPYHVEDAGLQLFVPLSFVFLVSMYFMEAFAEQK
jgi:hypothetical protein